MKPNDETQPTDDVDPYLWDPGAPADPEIARLEKRLAVLAYRPVDVPLPKADVLSMGDARAPRPSRVGWVAAAGAVALAASAMIGWFAGRSSSPAPIASTSTTVSLVNTAPVGPAPVPSTSSSAPRDARPSPCAAKDPGRGALRYEVVWGGVSCDGAASPEVGWLPLETWLETDGSSRVVLEVADLGRVELAPSTRLRILPALKPEESVPGQKNEHRLELERGIINARIDAPPRLFIVETKAASAIDLGCAYTLEVGEDGSGLLRVGKGEVALETPSGRPAVVHRGEVCETRVGAGAGTPFSVTSTPAFRRALSAWDFEGGALDAVVSAATKEDVAGLIRAIGRAASPADREKLVSRLDGLLAGPNAAERAGVLAGDKTSLDGYRTRVAKGAAKPATP